MCKELFIKFFSQTFLANDARKRENFFDICGFESKWRTAK
jgi:hypothetical protein